MSQFAKVLRCSNKNAPLKKGDIKNAPSNLIKKNQKSFEPTHSNVKRPASSPEEGPNQKRHVLGDVTNAADVVNESITNKDKEAEEKRLGKLKSKNEANLKHDDIKALEQRRSQRVRDRRIKEVEAVDKELEDITKVASPEEESCYESAQESFLEIDESDDKTIPKVQELTRKRHVSLPAVPEGVVDFDRETALDPFSVPLYAQDIFLYFREREAKFAIAKYMHKQREVTRSVRAILVDWLAEVQESFELNHETLYLAVKLVDMYLSRKFVSKKTLQLVGSTALLIAAKFDERCPPVVDDFLYICDDAYDRKQLLRMEINILKTIDFDLGVPLSYSYLRRFARCSKQSMETLTLSRYVLELSLLEYELIDVSESLIAAAALSLALQMKKMEPWSSTLEHYSSYKLSDISELIRRLNELVVNARLKNLNTIPTKYSHEVFFEVAKIPALTL